MGDVRSLGATRGTLLSQAGGASPAGLAGCTQPDRTGHPKLKEQARRRDRGSRAGASCPRGSHEGYKAQAWLLPPQGKGRSLQSGREVARDEPKSPGWRRVLQGALDTVEEHLAQEVHGLEDVLHGVDSARLGEEGERGAARGQGAHVRPGVHKNRAGYCLAS